MPRIKQLQLIWGNCNNAYRVGPLQFPKSLFTVHERREIRPVRTTSDPVYPFQSG